MKRILSLATTLLALTLTATAQQPLQFYYQGQPLDDGATVTINAETDAFGDLICETNPAGNPSGGLVLKNLTTADITGQSSLTITTNTMAPRLVQWCMGGLCVPIPSDTYDKEFTVRADGQILTQLDAFPTAYGELRAQISVTANLRTLTVNVVFQNADPDAPLTFVRRAVIEEYTGTWCGNCPRGIVGVQRLSEQFGDQCIAIAIHCGADVTEPMQIPTYFEVRPGDGVPCCEIDRGGKLDPYTGSSKSKHYNIDKDFAARLAEPVEAGVELTAQWNEAQQWFVRFDVTTTFNIDSEAAPYRLILVLLEDGLKGTGREWTQVNYFSTAAGFDDSRDYADDDMKWWRDAPYMVTDVEYNHVPVNTLGIKSGIDGSIQAPIVSGQPQTYTNKVTTLNVKVIQDKTRLSAVAMLLNTETGRIVNAAKANILPYGADPTAIGSVSAAPSVPSVATTSQPVYDLQGRRVVTPTPGLYIYNGKKIIIK